MYVCTCVYIYTHMCVGEVSSPALRAGRPCMVMQCSTLSLSLSLFRCNHNSTSIESATNTNIIASY